MIIYTRDETPNKFVMRSKRERVPVNVKLNFTQVTATVYHNCIMLRVVDSRYLTIQNESFLRNEIRLSSRHLSYVYLLGEAEDSQDL